MGLAPNKGSAMQMIDSAPQTATLVAELLTAQAVPNDVALAVRRVYDFERAVNALQSSLAAMPAAARDAGQREEITRLLSEVALFRIALADKTAVKKI